MLGTARGCVFRYHFIYTELLRLDCPLHTVSRSRLVQCVHPESMITGKEDALRTTVRFSLSFCLRRWSFLMLVRAGAQMHAATIPSGKSLSTQRWSRSVGLRTTALASRASLSSIPSAAVLALASVHLFSSVSSQSMARNLSSSSACIPHRSYLPL